MNLVDQHHYQIAATAGVLAEADVRMDAGESRSHALYLIEECLLDVEGRVELPRRA